LQFGPEIEIVPRLKARSHFQPWALGGRNAHGPEDNPKYYTLDALMKLNGSSHLPHARSFSPILKKNATQATISSTYSRLMSRVPSLTR
jgi:hypothetical protein